MKIVQTLVDRAFNCAATAHAGQTRKYKNEPYIIHPYAVAMQLQKMGHGEITVAAAFLHDVVEDTYINFSHIKTHFGEEVASIVREVTNVMNVNKNRDQRKILDRERLANASFAAQSIKYADMMHNVPSIVKHDVEFGRKYVLEKRLLLSVMNKGDQIMYQQALCMINAFEKFYKYI